MKFWFGIILFLYSSSVFAEPLSGTDGTIVFGQNNDEKRTV